MKKYLLLLTALFFTGCLNVIGIGDTPKQDDSWQQPKDEKVVQNKEQISKNAIDLLTPKCESGDAEACNDLGVNFDRFFWIFFYAKTVFIERAKV